MDFTCFDYVTVGVCIVDEAFTVMWWNRRMEEWTGKKRDNVIGMPLGRLFPHFNEDKYKSRISGLFKGGPPVILSSQLHPDLFFARTVTGHKTVQQATVSAFPAGEKGYYALFSIEDITNLSGRILKYREMRDRSERLSAEREVLLREMHHRIKNNLNMVAALINLRAERYGKQEECDELKNQIKAIGLVHEKLYRSDNASAVGVAGYLEEIVTAVLAFYPGAEPRVRVTPEELRLKAEQLIPLGLICNEVALNAVKHGFSGPDKAVFTAELARNEEKNEYVLVLSNTGRPFPESVDLKNPATMGLRLVTSLVKQLNGTVELERFPKTVYTIRFPGE